MPIVNKRNDRGMTPLYIAAVRADARMCDLLLKNGADPNIPAEKNRTALHEAALLGDMPTVEVLIKAGADTNARDSDQRIPLHYSVLKSSETDEGATERRDALARLIQGQGSTSTLDRYQMTPLHYAILNGYDVSLLSFVFPSSSKHFSFTHI